MRIAYELGIPEEAVMAMTPEQFSRWGAFVELIYPVKQLTTRT